MSRHERSAEQQEHAKHLLHAGIRAAIETLTTLGNWAEGQIQYEEDFGRDIGETRASTLARLAFLEAESLERALRATLPKMTSWERFQFEQEEAAYQAEAAVWRAEGAAEQALEDAKNAGVRP